MRKNNTDIRLEMDQLAREIDKHNHLYFVKGTPEISDVQYDRLYHRLKELELEYPTLAMANSPISKVGDLHDSYGEKIEHVYQMYSLDNVYSKEELAKWFSRFPADTEYWCDVKLDGMALEVVYAAGSFKRAVTRGDGTTGTIVNHVTKSMASIPEKLNEYDGDDGPYDVVVHGEVVVDREYLKTINTEIKKMGGKTYANARSLVSAMMNTKDVKIAGTGTSPLFFCAYSAKFTKPDYIKAHNEDMEELIDAGFYITPIGDRFNDIDKIWEFINNVDHLRSGLPFETDGVVIKVNDKTLQESFGYTAKAPKFAIAYKFDTEEKTTQIKTIISQVGPGGSITPVAILSPAVIINGVSINMVTLHNKKHIESKDIRINDFVRVRRAGEVIPEIIAPVKSLRPTDAKPYVFPTTCPSCKQALTVQGSVSRCVNINCAAVSMQRIVHFVSKAGLDIDGVGSGMVTRLYEENLIKDVVDLVGIDVDTLINRAGMTVHSATKIVNNIREAMRKATLEKFITALCIRHVSKGTARRLSGVYRNMSALLDTDVATLSSIPDIGIQTAESIVEYFSTEKTRNTVLELMNLGLNPEVSTPVLSTHILNGKHILFTGVFDKPRQMMEQEAAALGAIVLSGVSHRLNYIVRGDNASVNKINKAITYGINVLSIDSYRKLVGST